MTGKQSSKYTPKGQPVTIIGAGKIGEMICDFLYTCGDYQLSMIDQSDSRLVELQSAYPNMAIYCQSVADSKLLTSRLKGQIAVINACPFNFSTAIARAAKKAGCHYLDLTEDVASTRQIQALAEDAKTAFIPQCGLAPGFISIIASELARGYDTLHEIQMRVGALPTYPSNALKYNLTWSTDGLINEYLKPCDAIVQGHRVQTPPMEELEQFSLDGITYEAFNTSGGLGTMCETFEGKVDQLNYRTVRYPGHRDLMQVLLKDLRLSEQPDLLKHILENALPVTQQDVVLIFVAVTGQKQQRFVQETYASKIYGKDINGTHRSAIQITTACSICCVLDLLISGQLPKQGFIKQESISLEAFTANRFGCYYDTSHSSSAQFNAA